MKKLCYQLFSCLAGALLATACEPPTVQVSFAQPFPVGTAPAGAFARADQGQYQAVGDTTASLLIGPKWLLERRFSTDTLRTEQLDSLGLLRRVGLGYDSQGRAYQLWPLGDNSFRLRWERRDTLASLLGNSHTQVRRYHGWYYLNTPVAGQWQVERIGKVGGRFCLQYFNPDSLRVRALQVQMVQLARDSGRLLFMLSPQPGLQSRQVHRYAGLWLTEAEYQLRR